MKSFTKICDVVYFFLPWSKCSIFQSLPIIGFYFQTRSMECIFVKSRLNRQCEMWTFWTSLYQFSNTFRNYFTKAGNYFGVLYKICKMLFNADEVHQDEFCSFYYSLFFCHDPYHSIRAAGPQSWTCPRKTFPYVESRT